LKYSFLSVPDAVMNFAPLKDRSEYTITLDLSGKEKSKHLDIPLLKKIQ
jgi:hypothetical protein